MKEFCENPDCESPAFKEVPVSVSKPSDQKRTLCATCEEAYSWGVQHGAMAGKAKEVWLVAVADRGIVAYVHACADAKTAINALAALLDAHRSSVRRWLREAGIHPIVLGRGPNGAIRYRWPEVAGWLASRPSAE